jgi:hypothetical protein
MQRTIHCFALFMDSLFIQVMEKVRYFVSDRTITRLRNSEDAANISDGSVSACIRFGTLSDVLDNLVSLIVSGRILR